MKLVSARSKYMVGEIDAEKLMRRIAVLPAFGGRKGRVYRRIKTGWIELIVHRFAERPRKWGHYRSDSEVHLNVWHGMSEAALRELLIHELMHGAQRDWKCYRNTCKHTHCRHFVSKMKVAWRQAERRLGKLESAIPAGSNGIYLVNGKAA